jgi:hypothetical protein
MKPKLILCLALVLSGGLFAQVPSLFAADSPAPATTPAHTNAPVFSNASPILFHEGGADLPQPPFSSDIDGRGSISGWRNCCASPEG